MICIPLWRYYTLLAISALTAGSGAQALSRPLRHLYWRLRGYVPITGPRPLRCPNRIRKWWALGFKVGCGFPMNHSMQINGLDEFACMFCGFRTELPPKHFYCRCTVQPPGELP